MQESNYRGAIALSSRAKESLSFMDAQNYDLIETRSRVTGSKPEGVLDPFPTSLKVVPKRMRDFSASMFDGRPNRDHSVFERYDNKWHPETLTRSFELGRKDPKIYKLQNGKPSNLQFASSSPSHDLDRGLSLESNPYVVGGEKSKSIPVIKPIFIEQDSGSGYLCGFCDFLQNELTERFENAQSFRTHVEKQHSQASLHWVCKDISAAGDFLAECKACQHHKIYTKNYHAAAHLRRAHFSKVKVEKTESKTINTQREKMISMETLENWMSPVYFAVIEGTFISQELENIVPCPSIDAQSGSKYSRYETTPSGVARPSSENTSPAPIEGTLPDFIESRNVLEEALPLELESFAKMALSRPATVNRELSPSPSSSVSDTEFSFIFNGLAILSDEGDRDLNSKTDDLVDDLVRDFISRPQRHQDSDSPCPRSQLQNPGSASSERTSAGNSWNLLSSEPSSSRRKHRLEDEGEEGARRSKRPRADRIVPNKAVEKLLACPYTKFDPHRYSERNSLEKDYRACSSRYLTGIAPLKQHLYRVHRRRKYYCSSCFALFGSEQESDEHNRIRPACEVSECPFPEKMTADQQLAIKRREMGKDRVKAWYDIFSILFPGAPLPREPYVDSAPTEVIEEFCTYFQRIAPQRLSATVFADLYGDFPTSDELREHTNRVLEDCISLLVQTIRQEFQETSAVSSSRNAEVPALNAEVGLV